MYIRNVEIPGVSTLHGISACKIISHIEHVHGVCECVCVCVHENIYDT